MQTGIDRMGRIRQVTGVGLQVSGHRRGVEWSGELRASDVIRSRRLRHPELVEWRNPGPWVVESRRRGMGRNTLTGGVSMRRLVF